MYSRTSDAVKTYKDDYIIFGRERNIERLRSLSSIIVVSIDPAIKNFAFRVERRSPSGVETLVMLKHDFTTVSVDKRVSDVNKGGDIDKPYQRITDFLELYREFLTNLRVDIVLVERQVGKYEVIRISQHCITYFSLIFPSILIVEVSAKLKTRVLSAPKKMNYNDTKKWAIEKSIELMTYNKDELGLRIMRGTKTKLDDIADTVVQAEAFFTHLSIKPVDRTVEVFFTF